MSKEIIENYYIKKDEHNYYRITKSLSDWYVLHGYEVVNTSLEYSDGVIEKFHIIVEVPKDSLSISHKYEISKTFIEMYESIITELDNI